MSGVVTPRLSYFICSTPRSGSTLLCEVLRSTGIAGRPEEYYQRRWKTGLPRRPLEYFEGVETAEIIEILGKVTRVDDEDSDYDSRKYEHYADYLAWTIEQGTTPNGVFGAKLMWGYFNGFVNHLRGLPGHAEMSNTALFPSVFPNLEFVWVTRKAKLRQAVSLWKALQTWTWRRDESDGTIIQGDLRYSFDAIDRLVATIRADEQAWLAYFADCGIEPFVVVYEDFVENFEDVALEIVDFLRIERPRDLQVHPPKMTRQSDAVSEEWLNRYSADARFRATDRVLEGG
jgi:LPS sulfotransferase NodH